MGIVLIRVDANPTIGLGHLSRCMTLARQLCADGYDVQLVVRYRFGVEIEQIVGSYKITRLTDAQIGFTPRNGLEIERRDAEATLAILSNRTVSDSWVIVDNYELGVQWEKKVREHGHRILVIDDFRNRRHCADVLVSDVNVPFDPALNESVDVAQALVGSKFALVDPEFAFLEEIDPSVTSKKRLLVSYGGSDPTNETTKALEAIRILRHDEVCRQSLHTVDVVVGPANTRTHEVIRFANKIEDVIVHIAPRSLAPIMRHTDLFLTAGGNSMVEGLTMRKPCLVTLTSDNQAPMVAQLLEQGAILSLGESETVGPMDVAGAVTTILSEYEQFAHNTRTRPIFDHLGARRISEVIQSISKDKVSNYKYSRISGEN